MSEMHLVKAYGTGLGNDDDNLVDEEDPAKRKDE